MHTAAPTPDLPGLNRPSSAPAELVDETELMALLKRLATQDDAHGRRIELAHAQALMRYVLPLNDEVSRVLLRALKPWPADNGASPQHLHQLLAQPVPEGHFFVADDLAWLLKAAARRGAGGFLRYRHPVADNNSRAPLYQRLSLAVDQAVPGQHVAAQTLARSLALQLTDPSRSSPAFALLSGPLGSGARQAARAAAQALVRCGYQLVEIEMSQIRSDEEAAEIDGSQPYWKGSRPGKVTGAVYRHPKTVVLLHDLDKTLPAVQASLLPALRDGVMVDNFGLTELSEAQRKESSGRTPTPVPMRDAVLLATASHGHDLWHHPDMAALANAPEADLRDVHETVLQALRTGTRSHRGRDVPVFDLAALAQWQRHLVLFKPLRWPGLVACAQQAVHQACKQLGQRLQLPTTLAPGSAEAAGTAFLASRGGQVELDQLTPAQAEAQLFAPLCQALIDAELAAWASAAPNEAGAAPLSAVLQVRETDQAELHQLLAPCGHDPVQHLQRRRLALRFDVQVERTQCQWVVSLHQFRLAQVKDLCDYTGDTAISAVVPNVRFADVAGHDDAKRLLQDVIALYAHADQLRAQGLELPRGAVLHGPPGTGKTLLAQAMAAEAGMPFIATSGTDLLNMDRLRDVFALARKNAPCMIFIDEADALGRRGRNSSVHDAAINRLLAAIQGFDQRAPVYVLAATNRPNLLDKALTRPGRLDQSLLIGALGRTGRAPLIDKLINLLPGPTPPDSAYRERLLSLSQNMTGADLGQLIRETALRGIVQAQATPLGPDDLVEQLLSRKYGRRTSARSHQAMRERAAFHEAGHTVLHLLWFADLPIEQVTITARGSSEGFLAIDAEGAAAREETREAVRHFIGVLLGGRLAEQRRYGSERGTSSGCASDLVTARQAAFMAVAHQGLDEHLGELSLVNADDEDRSLMPDALKHEVWARVRAWLADAKAEADAALARHWPAVQALAAELLLHDYLPGQRVQQLWASHQTGGLATEHLAHAAHPQAPAGAHPRQDTVHALN